MISIKVLISLEISRFIPKSYLMLCRSSIYFVSCMLSTIIFTVDSYILKQTLNIPLRLSQLQSSILLMNTIIIYHIVKCIMLIILLYHTAISKEIILLVKEASKFEVKQPE